MPFPVGMAYHGKLSSASTGRLAALRLPLAVLSEEKVTSLEGTGTSTSISSPESDILASLDFWAQEREVGKSSSRVAS